MKKNNIVFLFNLFLLTTIIILSFGCVDNEKRLLGHWNIDKANMNDASVFDEEAIILGSVFFSTDNECVLPNEYKEFHTSNKWKIVNGINSLKIIFSDTSPFLNDTFNLKFINEDKITLSNKRKYLMLIR